ncbi:MAG: tetratricopeptide repeat protein, partial [Acidobacteria bacterium]|nr:tetratricopeptide repeat protein [Acidobacteriota bacterium]
MKLAGTMAVEWCFLMGVKPTLADKLAWKSEMDAGTLLLKQGRHVEAEEHLGKAMREAENFGSNDLRLAMTLNNLGSVHHT